MDSAIKFLRASALVLMLVCTPTAFATPASVLETFNLRSLGPEASTEKDAVFQAVSTASLNVKTSSRLPAVEAPSSEPPSLAIFGAGVIFAAGVFRRRVTA